MKTVSVALPGRAYDILIGGGLLERAGSLIAPIAGENAVAVVSDNIVWSLYGMAFAKSMSAAAVPFRPVILPAGESSKTIDGLTKVYEGFAQANLSRRGLAIAFGGGVIGDLAGFAAATWMRGISFVQIPTTLLAQVDSSVGGKTAIDLPAGKNLAGAFHQPKLVLADTALLQTLPERQLACGVAEVIKYGAICSRTLLDRLSAPFSKDLLPEIIEECCRIKADIVLSDELDTGRRMILNFGHTFGHAAEALGGFTRFTHGEAVAIGTVLAAEIGERAGVTRPGCAEKLRDILSAHNLPTDCPFSAAELLPQMALDKKGRSGGVDLILLADFGKAIIRHFNFAELELLLREVLR